jgi:hypothetical protein
MKIEVIGLLVLINIGVIALFYLLVSRRASAVATENALSRLGEQRQSYELLDRLVLSQVQSISNEYGAAQQRIGALGALLEEAEATQRGIGEVLEAARRTSREATAEQEGLRRRMQELMAQDERVRQHLRETQEVLETRLGEVRRRLAEQAAAGEQAPAQLAALLEDRSFLEARLLGREARPGAAALPLGTIIFFGSDQLPDGWLLCDGRALKADPASPYHALYEAIGDKWAQEGDKEKGVFRLPSLVEEDYALPTIIKFR